MLDVNLPDGNGFDFCKQIKERRPDTAVIFLTANDMESDMLKGFELGADDYVTKPFPISVFRKKVSALLGRIQKQTVGDCFWMVRCPSASRSRPQSCPECQLHSHRWNIAC